MGGTRQHALVAHSGSESGQPSLVDMLQVEALFEAVPDAVIVYDLRDRRVLAWNLAAERMFGYTQAEAAELRLEDLLPERLRTGIVQMLEDYLAGKPAGSEFRGDTIELPALHKSGRELFVQFSTTHIGNRTQCTVMTIVRDLTERQRLAEERERLLAATREHAARVSELARLKDDFTAMVAHELVAPVSSIHGLASLLERDGLSAEQARQMVAMIRSEAALLQRLVNDIRDAATMERESFDVDLTLVPVLKLVDEVAAAIGPVLQDHEFVVEPAPDCAVLADPHRVEQILRNLLSNAAKHTPVGTKVTLRARQRDGWVTFDVIDDGPGIDGGDLARIFEKFGRGRDAEGQHVPGVGLGLYLSRRIALAHGGDLTVVSEPGKGSTFSLSLKETRS